MNEPANDPANQTTSKPVARPEREFEGPIWKHPYFVYIWLSIIPFVLLLVAAYLAIKQGWLPNSGA